MKLTTKIIEESKPSINPQGYPTEKPYKIWDSGGLFLLVTPAGGKWWRLKYRYENQEKQLSLGTYPLVSLDEARSQRDALRALLTDGIDPSFHRQKEKMAKLAEEARRLAATRFTLENDGGLSIRLGNRCLALTPTETSELCSFLNSTRKMIPKETLCL
jgi:hypothetical protein